MVYFTTFRLETKQFQNKYWQEGGGGHFNGQITGCAILIFETKPFNL